MTFALPIPRLGRTKAWHLLLLLPVLPWTATWLDVAGIERASGPIQALSLVWLCLAAGVLAFRLPGWIARQPALIRKEIEQLRWPWMILMLAGQCSVLDPKDGDAFGAVVLMASALLLSAIPFGVEFQHRTVGHLLSQPTLRSRIWWIKMMVPGVALSTGGILLLLSWLACGYDLDWPLIRVLALGVLVAWAATPWLTLLARGMLPGLVFSMTLPALALIPVIAVAHWVSWPESTPEAERLIQWVSTGVIWGLFPLYAAAALIGSYRKWNCLEAADGQFELGAGLFLRGPRRGVQTHQRRRGSLAQLWVKELRLQSVTLIAVALLIPLAAAEVWNHRANLQQETLTYGLILLCGTIALLSGVTMIAEEQRLGTRDSQLLIPASLTVQWWIKFTVAAGLAGLAIGIGAIALRAQLPRGSGDAALALTIWCLLASFPFACWSSSARAHPLKALLWAIAWTAGAAIVLQLASQYTRNETMRISDHLFEIPTLAAQEVWLRKAQALGLPAIEAMVQRAGKLEAFNPRVFAIGAALAVLPLGVALILARRNFDRPAQAEHQWRRQNLVMAVSLIVSTALSCANAIWVFHRKSEAELLVASWHHAQWSKRLGPTDIELQQRYRQNRQWVWSRAVELELIPSADVGQRRVRKTATGRWAWFPLPLSDADRRLVIEGTRIDEALREALRREVASEPAP
ncbi:MAG: hypothetical protein JNK85_04045 [Verrucomicrobiales bacterium]|nr:hypothetical protein [Verrucomicrobiales bacterium]